MQKYEKNANPIIKHDIMCDVKHQFMAHTAHHGTMVI